MDLNIVSPTSPPTSGHTECLPIQPMCPQQSREEATGDSEPEQGCRSSWCSEGLCRTAMWDSTAPLQPEPESWASQCCERHPALLQYLKLKIPFICPQWLQASYPNNPQQVLERLLLAHLNRHLTFFRTLYSLLIVPGLLLMMPTSTCVHEPTLLWIKQAALWGSCSLISPETACGWMPPQPPRLLTTWQTEHSLWDWRFVCQRRWSAAQEHHRGLYTHSFSSLCTPQTSRTTQSPVISRNTLTTLQLLGVSVMEAEYRELVDPFVRLCGTINSSQTQRKPKRWMQILAGPVKK